MGTFMYGVEDHLECLAPAQQTTEFQPFPGQAACLGYHFSVHWFGLPWKVADRGYVITTDGGKSYIPLSADELKELQRANTIATPAPGYEVPVGWRIAGHSAWATLALILIIAVWRHKQARRLRDVRASAELTTTGPELTYGGDRALDAAIRPHLEPDEYITHQAYAYDREMQSMTDNLTGHKHLVALTDRRLLLITSKVGVLGAFTGKPTFAAIPRADIVQVLADEQTCKIISATGNHTLYVPYAVARYSSSNQHAFLADLPRLFGQTDIPRAVVHAP